MSPQHIDKLNQKLPVEPTLRDDIYAFGGTIFWLLTGTHPLDYRAQIRLKERASKITYKFSPPYPISFELVKMIHDSLLYDEEERPTASELIDYKFFQLQLPQKYKQKSILNTLYYYENQKEIKLGIDNEKYAAWFYKNCKWFMKKTLSKVPKEKLQEERDK